MIEKKQKTKGKEMIEEKQKTKGKEMIEEKQKKSFKKADKEPALSKKEVDAILSSLSQSTLEDLEFLDNDLTEAEKNAFLRAREIRKSFPKYKMTQFGMIDQELLSKMTYQSVLGVRFSDNKKYKLKAKDTFYMNGKTSHYLYNHGNSEALILWVTNPPMF